MSGLYTDADLRRALKATPKGASVDPKVKVLALIDAIAPAIAARALREAARTLPGFESIATHGDAAKWLRDRADEIERI